MNKGIFYRIAVKRQAKMTVLKNWIQFIGITLIYLVISFALELSQFPLREQFNPAQNPYIDYIILLIIIFMELIVISPVLLGIFESCMRIADGKQIAVGDLFLWFGEGRRYLKSVLINVQYLFIWILSLLITSILPAGILYYSYTKGYDSLSYIMVFILCVIFIFLCAKILTYFPGMYQLAEDPQKKPWACLKEAGKIFGKRKWDLLALCFSFFGWIFLIFIIRETAVDMELFNSGFLVLNGDGFNAITNIPVMTELRATIYSMLLSSPLMLYVLPYFFVSMAYYVKGVLDPDLFKPPVPPGMYGSSNLGTFNRQDAPDGSETSSDQTNPPADEDERDGQNSGHPGDGASR